MGHASAVTTGAAKPHGDVDVATYAAVDCCRGSVLQLFQCDGNHTPPSLVTRKAMGTWLSGIAIVSLSFTDDTAGAAQVIFGTEPRISSGAPRSTRINKPKFSPWLLPQSSNHRSAGGACTTSEPYSDLLQRLAHAQNQTPLQLIISYIVHSLIKWKISVPWTERLWYPSCWLITKLENWHGSTC